MRELHGEPGALIECARIGVEGSVREGEEGCESSKVRRGTSNVVEAMSVGTKSTESMKEGEPKFLGAREKEYTEPFATSESNNVARHSFAGLSKKWGDFCGEVNGGGSPNTDSFDSVGNGTVCSESLGIGAGNVHNVRKSGMRKELIDEIRMGREVVMYVKRRDFMRLRFDELTHVVFTGEGGQVSRK